MPLGDYAGYTPGFSDTATKAAGIALEAEKRGQMQSSADQFARFGPALGSAQEATQRGIGNQFADVGAASGRNIALAASSQDLMGRRSSADQYFQTQEQTKDLDTQKFLTDMSLNQRNKEIQLALDTAAKRRATEFRNSMLSFLSSMIAGGSGGVSGMIPPQE